MTPDHGKIYEAVHEHDLRLLAVETELRGVHKEMKDLKDSVTENTRANHQLLHSVHQIDLKAEGLATGQSIIMWIIGLGAASITLLEIYAVFSR
jgi:hypothetical protein